MVCNLLPTDTLDLALLSSSDLESLPEKLSKDLDRLEDRFRAREVRVKQLKDDAERALASTGGDGKEQFKNLRAIRA